MAVDRSGARLLSALLAFVLLASFGQTFGAHTSTTVPQPAQGATTGDPYGAPGDTGGEPGVLPPPSRIHVLVNRAVDGPGAPSYAAAVVASRAAAHPGHADRATTTEPPARDRTTAGSWWGRAPPHTHV
jgi:hypothetical protein